jgi:hypothetical protein
MDFTDKTAAGIRTTGHSAFKTRLFVVINVPVHDPGLTGKISGNRLLKKM